MRLTFFVCEIFYWIFSIICCFSIAKKEPISLTILLVGNVMLLAFDIHLLLGEQ